MSRNFFHKFQNGFLSVLFYQLYLLYKIVLAALTSLFGIKYVLVKMHLLHLINTKNCIEADLPTGQWPLMLTRHGELFQPRRIYKLQKSAACRNAFLKTSAVYKLVSSLG